MKKYMKPTLTKVMLNSTQSVLSVCSTFPTVTKAGGAGATCKSSAPPASKCKKLGVGGNNAGLC